MGTPPALKALLLAAIIGVAGCATMDNVPTVPDAAWFGALLAANQYGQAAAALAKWKQPPAADAAQAGDPQLAQLEQDYIAAAARFRRQTVQDAKALQEQQQWGEADQLLLTAMQQLPNDDAFAVHYRRFDEVREEKRQQMQYAFDVAYAQNLPQMLRSARAIYDLKPQDESAATRLQQLQADADSVSARLALRAQAALAADDLMLAERDYRLAAALSADEALLAKSAALTAQLEQDSAQKQRAQQRSVQAGLQSQLRELDALLDRNQLEAAGDLLGQLRRRHGDHRDLQARQLTFDALRRKYVAGAIERGSRHYSAGELAKAIDVWERAHLLDPGNIELRDRIDRARRFRAKVEALQ